MDNTHSLRGKYYDIRIYSINLILTFLSIYLGSQNVRQEERCVTTKQVTNIWRNMNRFIFLIYCPSLEAGSIFNFTVTLFPHRLLRYARIIDTYSILFLYPVLLPCHTTTSYGLINVGSYSTQTFDWHNIFRNQLFRKQLNVVSLLHRFIFY